MPGSIPFFRFFCLYLASRWRCVSRCSVRSRTELRSSGFVHFSHLPSAMCSSAERTEVALWSSGRQAAGLVAPCLFLRVGLAQNRPDPLPVQVNGRYGSIDSRKDCNSCPVRFRLGFQGRACPAWYIDRSRNFTIPGQFQLCARVLLGVGRGGTASHITKSRVKSHRIGSLADWGVPTQQCIASKHPALLPYLNFLDSVPKNQGITGLSDLA